MLWETALKRGTCAPLGGATGEVGCFLTPHMILYPCQPPQLIFLIKTLQIIFMEYFVKVSYHK